MSQLMDIDGSVLEGGGQILRISVSLSAILGVPIRVTNIRAGRQKPGLAAQHMKGIQLVAQMCGAKTRGVEIGSTVIEFTPGKIKGGHYVIDVGTAGAISLLLQVSLPCALLADSAVTLDLKGGTNVPMAPQVDYLTEVFRPVMEKFGGTFDFDLHRRGYYPRGGGHVTARVSPVSRLSGVSLTEPGAPDKVFGWSFVAGRLPIRVAHEMCDGAKRELCKITRNIEIECYKESGDMAPDNCNGIIILCESSTGCVLGGAALGSRDLDPSTVGLSAAAEVTAVAGKACLDTHAQDQVIVLMALAHGKSSVRVGEITLHTRTAIHVATTIAKVQFNITPQDGAGGVNIIECTGLGIVNQNIPPT